MSETLFDARVTATLDRLHELAKGDRWVFLRGAPSALWSVLTGGTMLDGITPYLKDAYIPITPDQGRFLYLSARLIQARTIVEFGTSFGISTLYLAAAVKDNGGGVVVGSELDASKHAKAREHLRQAGLEELTDIRLGDALQTLASVEGPIDMVLLDGWKDSYLPVLKLLQPKLKPRAIVLADNIFRFKRALRTYVEYVQSGTNGFVSSTLEIADGFELSVFTG